MAAQAILVVVAVRDAGLRSALAAHLSLDGLDLLTASGVGQRLLASAMIREPAVLVVEESMIAADADDWIGAQRERGSWRHLVVLNGAVPGPVNGGEWLVRIGRRNARKLLSELLAGWGRDEARNR